VISLGEWASKVHLKRFRREAEAAASLNHPSIVPIYEVGERDGSCYFSMQFIEGGQLDEVVKRTPMSIRHAAELLVKIARTVHFAHEQGILHRDIKPGNILLDRKGEPHLTDFGLARLVETESTVTRTLEVLGTPSCMAPEQATGKNAELTSATDVYGLGAVLYQLLTGHPPFAGGATYETIKLLLDTEPLQPRQLNPKVDRDLSTICLKCLEKDPKRRYSSALALAEDLQHWLKHEPIRARHTGIFTGGRKWIRRNPTRALLAASLIALPASAGWIVWKSEVIRHPVAKGIAVLPFENLSGNPDNAYFADGIQEEILTRLAKIADLKVISRASTQRYQGKPRNLAQIANQLGVANILEGSVQKAADQVRVNVQLINAETDSHLWADTYDRKLTDILGVESEIAKEIADALQMNLTSREQQALAVTPTNNPEAYDSYLLGLAFEARHSAILPMPSLEAAGFYGRAVELDPNFAIAWARLSRADALLCFNVVDTDPAARCDAAKRALDHSQRLEPNSPETLLALGYYQFLVQRDYGLAKATFGRVAKILPRSSEVPFALAKIARREGHWDESVACWEQALARDTSNLELLMGAAWTYAMLRQFPPPLKLYDRALDITPYDPNVIAAKANIYQAQGHLRDAAKLLTQVDAQTPSVTAFRTKVNQFRLERNYGEAVRLLQARLAQFNYDTEDPNLRPYEQVALALTQRLAGDMVGAASTAQQVRNAVGQLSEAKRDGDYILAILSRANAELGEKDSALKEAERAYALSRADDAMIGPRYEENLALIHTFVGQSSPAISSLTHLLQTPYFGLLYSLTPITPAFLRLDSIWDPLRADPAFQKLCEEKQK
jgi:TolB-like protein/tRNA A-37 threonylcarbamoyl transferase component Bud32/Tfp pilus assembly protein PilF